MILDGNIIGQLFLILFLTVLNAFFAASEIAVVSINKRKIQLEEETGNKKAQMLLDILKEPSKFLSTIQVGITFAGFFLSASAAVGISHDLGLFLESKGIPFGEDIAFIGITILLSYIMLVFGELLPKRMALQNPEKLALAVIKPINIFGKILTPFVIFLSFSTNILMKLFGFSTAVVEDKITLDEILSIINVGQEQGIIDSIKKERIDSVISFDDKVAEEIMTARTNVFMMDIANPIDPKEADSELMLKHSRFPIYKESVDNIIGIVHLKDYLLQAYRVGFENIDINKIMKLPYFVSQRKNINDLFLELQRTGNHFAVLINEYGGFPGIVTMEDLVEEIIGDIYDENDQEQPDIEKVDKNIYYVKGYISIKELNSKLDLELDEDAEHYDTLGGLLIYLLGYIPTEEDKGKIRYKNLQLDIVEIKRQRIYRVKITLLDDAVEE